MYKVFFNDRTVFFDDDFSSSFKVNSGLFYRYRDKEELKELIDAFFRLHKINRLYLFHDNPARLREEFISLFVTIEASGGLVRRNNREFLMIFRNGKWDLPKGKVDAGETSREAALREVSEECGLNKLSIKSEIIKTYHTYALENKPILKETTWYAMESSDKSEPVPQESENITRVCWFRPEDMGQIVENTYPSIIEVLKASQIF